MKRLFIIAATLFTLCGLAYAGGGYEYEAKPQPQEQMWVQRKYKQLVKDPAYKWTIQDYCSVAGVVVTTIGVAGGLYFNSRRKKA
jgi:hypothetical protein